MRRSHCNALPPISLARSPAALTAWVRRNLLVALCLLTGPAHAVDDAIRLAGDSEESSRVGGDPNANRPYSGEREISFDGRYVVFTRTTPGQSGMEGVSNVFLYDAQTSSLRLVSHASGSPTTGGNRSSNNPAISANGRFVAYNSCASNLLEGFVAGANGCENIYRYDVVNDVTILVSRASGSPTAGANRSSEAPVISTDGQIVAYESCATDLIEGFSSSVRTNCAGGGLRNIFRFDATSGSTRMVSHAEGSATVGGNGVSRSPAISADGQHLVYESCASTLIFGFVDEGSTCDRADARGNIYHYDAVSDLNHLISHASDSTTATGNQESRSPTISANGRSVAYHSRASNLIAGFIVGGPSAYYDVYFHDLASDRTLLVSHSSDSVQTGADRSAEDPLITGSGFVFYSSCASNLIAGGGPETCNVYGYDVTQRVTRLVSHTAGVSASRGNGESTLTAISRDGRFVVYESLATDLISGFSGQPQNVYRYDSTLDQTLLLSHARGAGTTAGNDGSYSARISGDGNAVAFNSYASDLSAQVDRNDQIDAYYLVVGTSRPTATPTGTPASTPTLTPTPTATVGPTATPSPTASPVPTSTPQPGSSGGGALSWEVLVLGLLGWRWRVRQFR